MPPRKDKSVRGNGRTAEVVSHYGNSASTDFDQKKYEQKGVKYLRDLLSTSKDNPILFLLKVIEGKPIMHNGTQMFASLEQRIEVALKLAGKMLPDLKAIDLTGLEVNPNAGADQQPGDVDEDELLNKLSDKLDYIAATRAAVDDSSSEVRLIAEGGAAEGPELPEQGRKAEAPVQLEVLGSSEPAPARSRPERPRVADVVAARGTRVREDAHGRGVGEVES